MPDPEHITLRTYYHHNHAATHPHPNHAAATLRCGTTPAPPIPSLSVLHRPIQFRFLRSSVQVWLGDTTKAVAQDAAIGETATASAEQQAIGMS